MINTRPPSPSTWRGWCSAGSRPAAGFRRWRAQPGQGGLLYEALDASDFYVNRIARDDRSLMNVVFHLADPALDAAFLEGAKAAGLVAPEGHRLVGGMRASIYNAMPIEGVRALVAYMKDFEARRGLRPGADLSMHSKVCMIDAY
jgi:hypothetical protein